MRPGLPGGPSAPDRPSLGAQSALTPAARPPPLLASELPTFVLTLVTGTNARPPGVLTGGPPAPRVRALAPLDRCPHRPGNSRSCAGAPVRHGSDSGQATHCAESFWGLGAALTTNLRTVSGTESLFLLGKVVVLLGGLDCRMKCGIFEMHVNATILHQHWFWKHC